jgi:hypothetical protein
VSSPVKKLPENRGKTTMPYDYSTAPPPRDLELVPAGTVASVQLRIRPGGAGEDGQLKRSKDGACEMLDCECVLVDGPYSRRKFWINLVLEGTTAGHAQAAEISRGILRGILESARGIRPDDMSDEARKRRMASLKDFDNIVFVARIGIEKGTPRNDGKGDYPDKNVIAGIITPDKKEWHPTDQPLPFNGGGAGAAASSPPSATPAPGVAKPSWAS